MKSNAQPSDSAISSVSTAATAPVASEISLDDPALYANREISWLDFNERVLWEARDPRNPLSERIRYLAITASNLDEFASKRIGWLRLSMMSDPAYRTVDGMTIADQLQMVRARVQAMQAEIDSVWHETLEPLLAEQGIRVVSFEDVDADARDRLREYFISAIYPVLTPLVVDPAHPFPFISGSSLSLVLTIRVDEDRRHFARVKVPPNRPRFVQATEGVFVRLEELIESHLDMLFPGVEIENSALIRVLRSSEVGTPGEDAADLLELMEDTLARRRMADAVSMEVQGDIPPTRMGLLLEVLRLQPEDVYQSDVMLGLNDLFQLASIPLPDASFPPFTPAVPTPLIPNEDEEPHIFVALRTDDVLVHHPYESFDQSVARLIRTAAEDPQVLAIKHTTYRTSPDSPILGALIEAAGRGKQVAVLVELAARFDEANNIDWARRLEGAGVHVSYGNPNQKIHAKISLIVREESTTVTTYSHIGTGNYNSGTARVYTDFGLLTSDPEIGHDLMAVFNHLTGVSTRLDTHALLVAPYTVRSGLEERVRREMAAARRGEPAHLIFKINALEDAEFTRLLYEAGQAGVRVDLIVRGICRIRPGIAGLSENIHVRSVIGRFLEHSRVFYFENGGDPEVFIGSADIMKRNLDERTEVLTPVKHPALRARIRRSLDWLLEDRRQAWLLQDLEWSRDQSVEEEGVHTRLLAMAPFS
ncbi:MAG: polyphosphate kinase 1 [Dehalococcoidia bacterium]